MKISEVLVRKINYHPYIFKNLPRQRRLYIFVQSLLRCVKSLFLVQTNLSMCRIITCIKILLMH